MQEKSAKYFHNRPKIQKIKKSYLDRRIRKKELDKRMKEALELSSEIQRQRKRILESIRLESEYNEKIKHTMKHLLGLLNIYDVPKEKWGYVADEWLDYQEGF